jgi:hypothetical protein
MASCARLLDFEPLCRSRVAGMRSSTASSEETIPPPERHRLAWATLRRRLAFDEAARIGGALMAGTQTVRAGDDGSGTGRS